MWDTLDAVTRERAVDWFSPVVGDEGYPRNNWVWFRIVVQTFSRSVGGPWSPDDIAADLARHDSFVREDGWLADGDDRSYDHYVGWALHTYPVLWSRMSGAAELAASRTAGDIARLDRFLDEAVAGALRSGIRSLSGGKAYVMTRTDAGPLGACSAVPVVDLDVAVGRLGVVVLDLRGAGLPVRTDVSVRVEDDAVEVVWADGVRTSHRLSARS